MPFIILSKTNNVSLYRYWSHYQSTASTRTRNNSQQAPSHNASIFVASRIWALSVYTISCKITLSGGAPNLHSTDVGWRVHCDRAAATNGRVPAFRAEAGSVPEISRYQTFHFRTAAKISGADEIDAPSGMKRRRTPVIFRRTSFARTSIRWLRRLESHQRLPSPWISLKVL